MTQKTMTLNNNLTSGEAHSSGPAAETPWAHRLAGLSIGKTRSTGGLSLYPLLGEREGMLAYQTLDDALAAGILSIGEIGSSGTVPELELKNGGDCQVLIVDGEELIGAKQNRIVNTSVLVGAGSMLMLPVSCVEAGRWRAVKAAFRSEGTHYNARGRQKKVREVTVALAAEGRPQADQGRIWADVDAKLSRLSVGSETRALHAVTEAHGADLDKFTLALGTPQAREIGAVFALGSEIIGVDLFDQSTTLTALLPKLVASYALDAIEERHTAAPPPAAVVSRWLKALGSATGDASGGVGLGEDVRLSGPGLSGAALTFEGAVAHLSAFRAETQTGSAPAGMVRSSVRRRQA